MRFSLSWALGLGLVDASIIPLLGDSTVSQSYQNSGLAASFGTLGSTTTVNNGVTAWLSGGTTHNFFGNVNNYGNIIVSQTDFLKLFPFTSGMSSYFTGTGSFNGNLNNYAGAFISLNDFGAVSGASYYWTLNTMTNYGDIQWCGRGDTGGSTFSLMCVQSCTNNGLIDFGQYNGNFGAAFYWRNDDVGKITSINNEGAFRLTNVVFHNTQNIYGSGCWVLNSGGVLYLEDGTGTIKNPSRGPSFPGQKIVFAQDGSTIHMDTAVYSSSADFGADVYGFGQNKALEFFQPIVSFSYSGNLLTVIFALNMKVNIRIGAGYDTKLFRSGLNTQHYGVYNAIFYDGPTPDQSVPGVCSVARGICANPETTVGAQPPASSASTTATSSPSSSSFPSSFATTTTTAAPSVTRSTAATTTTTISTTTTTTTTSSTTVTLSPSTTSLIPTTTTINLTFSFSSSSSSTTAAPSSSSNTAVTTIPTTTFRSTTGGPSFPPTTTRPSTTTTTTTSTTPTAPDTVAPSMTTTTKQLTTTTAIPTTTPASSMTSTSITLSSATSTSTSSPTCGVVGYDRQNPAAYQRVYAGKTSFALCRSVCSSGLSFAVGDTDCLCYAASLLDNFRSDPTSIYTFYDAACPVPSSTTTSLSNGITSTTSTVSSATTSPSATVTTTSTTATTSTTTSAITTASTTNTSTAASTTTTVTTTSSTTTPSAAASTTASATMSMTTTTTSASKSAQTTSSTSLSTSGNSSPSTTSSGGTSICAGGAAPDSTYVASNGDVYGICKNTDFAGGDLSAVGGITSAGACSEACSQTAGCVAGSLLRSNGYCYLKSTRDSASVNSGVDSVYKLSSGGSGPSTTGGATITSSTSGTVSTTSSSQTDNTTTIPKTTTTSSQTTSSPAMTTSSTTSNTLSSTSAVGTTTTTGGTGPCADGAGPSSTYIASNGDVYGVCLNTDFPGGDFDSVGGISTNSGCAEACTATPGCVAGSLLRGASRCYLKSSRGPASQNMGVDSVYKISSGSGNPVSTTAATITTSAGMSTSSLTTGVGSGTTTTPGSCNCPTNTVTVTVTATVTPTSTPKRG